MAYKITSDKGKKIAKDLKKGETYKASDGSTWKKNKDGSVSVTTKSGNVTKNALSGDSKPTTSGGGNSNKSSNSSSTPSGNYNVTTQKGIDIAQNLVAGGTGYTASDGSVWKKNNDGTVSVTTKNGTKQNLTVNGQAFSGNGTKPPVDPVTQNEWETTDTQVKQNPILTGSQLANMYGVTYDFKTINDLLQKAVGTKYDALEKDYMQNEGQFYDGLYGLQSDALSTLKQSRGSAISNGASAGVSSANELLTMLGLGQQSSALATTLAQDRQLLADKKGADTAQATSDALTYANQQGVNLGNLASAFQAGDTQFSVGAMDAIARIQASNNELAASKNYNKSSSGYSGGGYSGGGYSSGSNSTSQYKNINEMVAANDFWSWASTMGLSTNLSEATKQWNALGKYTPAQQYAAQQKAREGTNAANAATGVGSTQSTNPNNADPNLGNNDPNKLYTDSDGRQFKWINGKKIYTGAVANPNAYRN